MNDKKAEQGKRDWFWWGITAVVSWVAGWLAGQRKVDALQRDANLLQQQLLAQGEAEAALREAKRAAEAANEAKSEFVSFVSHELQTPMTTIMGYIDFLTDESVGPVEGEQVDHLLAVIRTNVDRMAQIVSDMQDISHMEMAQLHLEASFMTVADVIGEVQASMAGVLAAKEQQLIVDVAEDLPLVWADYGRVVQIVMNLVSNAHKYSPEGGVVRIRATVQEGVLPAMVMVSVKDNGYGIREADQRQIFNKFFRSADKDIRRVPGTGLGLNIVKRLVELQGGRVWLESEYGRGTAVYFTLPTKRMG